MSPGRRMAGVAVLVFGLLLFLAAITGAASDWPLVRCGGRFSGDGCEPGQVPSEVVFFAGLTMLAGALMTFTRPSD